MVTAGRYRQDDAIDQSSANPVSWSADDEEIEQFVDVVFVHERLYRTPAFAAHRRGRRIHAGLNGPRPSRSLPLAIIMSMRTSRC
jgi:hypothetical protein